ncbi:MAG: sigma-70 family RNA polymerase sigma factor [Chloroflexi bacterium]|nr:sigma-70 family RNA polymerase sigma factor [Chloroflexota bacterium]
MSLSSEGTPPPVAFEQLVEEYGDRVYGIALRMTGSPSEAEDVMQDAFLSAFRAWAEFRHESSPRTWLYRIVVNAALQRLRGRRPTELLPAGEPEYDPSADWSGDLAQAVVRGEIQERLEASISALPEDLRVTLVLRDIEGLSTAETAATLEISEAAVKSRLHRARLALRQALARYFAEQ